MKQRGFLFLLATFFLSACVFPGQREEPNLIAEASSPVQETLFAKPMRAAFLLNLRGEDMWMSSPDRQFVSERVYLTPQAENVVFFRASDVTWGEFFSTLKMSVEGSCITVADAKTCAQEGEQLHVVLNSESHAFDPNWKMNSGDRLYIGIAKEAPSREQLARVPDPWTMDEASTPAREER